MTPICPTAAFLALLLAAGAGVGVSGPVRAEEDSSALKRQLQDIEGVIENDRARAERLAAVAAEQARQLSSLRAEMQAAARAVHSHESAITGLEHERAGLRDDIANKRASFAGRREQLGTTLAALQRIALRPSAALLVSGGDPNNMVRSGLVMRTAIPQIEARAMALRDELVALDTLDRQLGGNKRDLAEAVEALAEEQGRLAGLVERKNKIFEATRAEQEAAAARIARLTREARSLGDLLDALLQRGEMHTAAPSPRPRGPARGTGAAPQQSAAAPAPLPGGVAVSSARGQLTPPAQGQLVVAFGDRNEFGATAHGVTWQVRSAASILAPWDGRVVFAGPFRHFGQILIIDHGEGYHSLIAGLSRTDARAGQWVLAGEPVGTAGERAAGEGGRASSGPGDRTAGPTVYVEFRRNGKPINPLPWLAASLDRTNG